MGLGSRTLEITVISGENINVTEDAYVVVRGESLKCFATKKSSFLSWNEKFSLEMPAHARSITFEVQCNKFKSARPVGVARIALSDFLGSAVQENCLHVLSYRLRDWEGRPNGVIHFSVRVSTVLPAVTVKDYGQRFTGTCAGEEHSSGVVIGIPVLWNYPNII